MKTDGLRLLGWIIPIVCMTGAAWVLYGQNQAFAESSNKRNQANREVEEAQKEKDLYSRLKPGERYAAADDIPLEETAFLNYLRTQCFANKVRFDRYQTQTIEYGKDKGATPADPQKAALLKGIRKVSSTITFVGDYKNVRALLGILEASTRLYTLTDVSWVLSKEGTTLRATIARYVMPPKPGAKVNPLQTPKPGEAKPGANPVPGGVGTVPNSASKSLIPMNSAAPAQPGLSPGTGRVISPGMPTRASSPPKSPSVANSPVVSPGVHPKP